MKNEKPKKPIFKRWWFWVLVVLIVGGALAPKEKAAVPAPDPAVEAAPARLSFELSADDPGEYGQEIVLNAGTENEYHCYAFHIPAGDYRVTYKADKGGAQVSIYETGVSVRGDGVEEFVVGEQKPIVIMAGESATFHIDEGQYVKLPDGQSQLLFELL